MSKSKTNMTDSLINNIMDAQQLTPEPPAAPDPVYPAPDKMPKAAKTASVYLSADQHMKLQSIAMILETNKHAVMQLAIKHFIEDWDNGYRPKSVYRKIYY